ncbi:MAG TPA: glucoamylase family protein [Telluria sp.]
MTDPNYAFLTSLQQDSFAYFVHEVNEANGLVADKTAAGCPASIAAVGMALTVYTIGAERGFMSRERAAQRTLTTLRFFADSEQSKSPHATGYKGFYYHFLDMDTGKRAWNCELSSIDTALLIAGVLSSRAYFRSDDAVDTEIRALADLLYHRVDWQWMLAGAQTICHGWKPGRGFLKWHWEGYDEALILYLLALGAPTYPIGPEHYAAWTRSYEWISAYGISYLYAGPLFIHQMSHLWVDFRGIRDDYMRARDCDYFDNSRRATHVQQRYAIDNPRGFKQYSELCFGVTASDGPGYAVKSIDGVRRTFYNYLARGAPYGPDDGTVAPWAVAASLAFAPDIVLPSLQHFHHLRQGEANPYGFKASYSPTFKATKASKAGWVSPYHFGINEGPTVIMIENYLHDLTWRTMRACPSLKLGLTRAGFSGGWLADATAERD